MMPCHQSQPTYTTVVVTSSASGPSTNLCQPMGPVEGLCCSSLYHRCCDWSLKTKAAVYSFVAMGFYALGVVSHCYMASYLPFSVCGGNFTVNG